MTISSINTSKGELRYAKCCSGPRVLIMLPGVSVTSVLNSAAAVETAYQSFDGKYTIYLFEYPGEYPDGEDIPYIADILAEAIHSLELKNCYLLGASFGGMVGQVLLAEHPELFVSAVLASTIAQLTGESPKTISRWHTIASNNDVRTLNLAFFDAVYSDEYQIKFAEPIRKTLDNGNEKDCLIMAVHTGMMLRADLREYDKIIKTPTLVVGATNDQVFSHKDVSEVAGLIGCKTFFYEGSSHAVFDEEPDFKQRVLEHYDTSVDDNGLHISKLIPGKKIPNLRDLGGMKGADGKRIREGSLIRSAQLYNATKKDLELLESLHIRKIFDFRNAQEAKEKPDPGLGCCEYMNLSILDSSSAVSWETNRTEQSGTDSNVGKGASRSGIEQMCEVYRDFVRKPASRQQYSRFLLEIANTENGAVLWHCTLGKDRCGWGSALVEAVLGVSREDIMADYLYSNVCLKHEIAGMMPVLKKLLIKMHLANAGTAVVEAREEYLLAALDEIDKLYGSMDVFLEKGLNIDEAMREKLRARYLI